MRQKLVFKINSKEYEKDKYSFQNDNFMININNVDIKKLVLSTKTNFLKYIEIWAKIVFLFNKDTSRNFTYDTEYIKPKLCQFNENRHDINKILKKGNYYGTLILSIDYFICEVARNLAMNLVMNLIIKR